MKIRNFRELDVWKVGKEIVLDVYRATATFPKVEVYGLVAQMRKASISIPSNVAEGFNRFHNKEYRQFLFIALGSCAELETQVEISSDLGYVQQNIRDLINEKLDHEARMLRNLLKKL
ncbi:MAG: four helix bundle protein [Nitrospira sp.]|nr:four helix bundle protein [Nitrospira sp.]